MTCIERRYVLRADILFCRPHSEILELLCFVHNDAKDSERGTMKDKCFGDL